MTQSNAIRPPTDRRRPFRTESGWTSTREYLVMRYIEDNRCQGWEAEDAFDAQFGCLTSSVYLP